MAYQGPVNGGRINASMAGNMANAATLISTGTLVLSGGNNITLSQNGQSIGISAANAAAGSVNFSASNASANLASVTFSNSNGLSFGLNAGVITGAYSVPNVTNSSLTMQAGASTLSSVSRIAFGDGNGISFGASTSNNGSITITGTVATNYAASTHTHGNPTLALTNLSGTTASASNGLTLSISGPANVQGSDAFGMSNLGNTAGTTGMVSGSQFQFALAGGNNITLSQSLNASSGTITVSGASFANANNVSLGINGGTVTGSASFNQSNQNLAMTATGANTVQNSTGTMNATNMIWSGAGNASVGFSNGTAYVSATQSVQTQNLMTVNGTQGNVSISGGPNITVGNNASTITLSAAAQTNQTLAMSFLGNTTQNSTATVDARSLSFNGLGNVTVGYSNGSIQISATGGGGGGGGVALSASNSSFGTGTVQLANAGGALTIGTAAQQINFSVPATSLISGTGAVSVATNGNVISIGAPPMFDAGISNLGNTTGVSGLNTNGLVLAGGNNITLSQNTDVNGATVTINGGGTIARWEYPTQGFNTLGTMGSSSLSLQHIQVPYSVTGTAVRLAVSLSLNSISTTGTTGSAAFSLNVGLYSLNGSTLSSITSGSTLNGFSFTSGNYVTTAFNGVREITAPMNASIPPGEYWIGALVRSGTSGTALSASLMGLGTANINASASIGVLGVNITASARDVYMGQGVYSTTTSAMPVSIPLSAVVNTVSNSSLAQRAAFYHVIYSALY